MIKAVLFDFDGVIAESVNVKTEAFSKLYEEYGPETVEKVVEHHLTHCGVSRFEKIRHYHKQYLGKAIDEDELAEWCQRFSDLVLEAVISSPYVPGAVELMEDCQKKYSCFIISGTPQDEMELIIARKGLQEYFIEIHGSPRTKTEIAREIISSHNLHPKEIIYLGDAMTDYDAAKEAGINFIGRVPEGDRNVFPSDVFVIPDFRNLRILEAYTR
jgi:HAD superfamily hydrolase (TIGR01549 family)